MMFKVCKILLFPQQIVTSSINITNNSNIRFSSNLISRIRESGIDLNDRNIENISHRVELQEVVSINNEEQHDHITDVLNTIVIEDRPLNILEDLEINSNVVQEYTSRSNETLQIAQEHLNQVNTSNLNLFSPTVAFTLIGGAALGVFTYYVLRKYTEVSGSNNIININSIPESVRETHSNFNIARVTTTRTTVIGENLDLAIIRTSSSIMDKILDTSKKIFNKFSNIFNKKN